MRKRMSELKPQILAGLRQPTRDRFARLEAAYQQLASQNLSREKWFGDLVDKTEYLVERFLTFAQKEAEFRNYLRSVLEEALLEQGVLNAAPMVKSRSRTDAATLPGEPPLEPADEWAQQVVSKIQTAYDVTLQRMESQMAHDPEDLTTHAVIEKRKDVLQRRRDYVAQIGRTLSNLNHQLELIEDTFGLINDEIRATSPEQVLADIDDVIFKADALTEVLNEMGPAH